MSKLSQPNTGLTEARPFASMSRVNPHAAGIDIGAYEIMVCLPGDENTQLVRSFGTYTADLHAIIAWLKEHRIETVAMESTGVYWIPLFETLEAAGFRCHLISPAPCGASPDARWKNTKPNTASSRSNTCRRKPPNSACNSPPPEKSAVSQK